MPYGKYDEHKKLNHKVHQPGYYRRNGNGKTREIHFSEKAGVAHKRGRSVCQTGRKIVPYGYSAHIEQEIRHAVGGEFCDVAENKSRDKRAEKRVYYYPCGTENRLFVHRGKIALDKKIYQIAVLPQFF